jgi:hypothetical protein
VETGGGCVGRVKPEVPSSQPKTETRDPNQHHEPIELGLTPLHSSSLCASLYSPERGPKGSNGKRRDVMNTESADESLISILLQIA